MDGQSELAQLPARQVHDAPGVSRIALNIGEAADALGVSRKTITAEIMKGTIKVRKFGRYKLIGVDQLKKLFNK